MSLVRLLATGKSLVGIQETTSRYHPAGQNWLPKFGSAKNPFAFTVAADCAGVAGQPPSSDAAKSAAPSATFKKTQRLPRPQLPTKVAPETKAAPRRAGGAKFAGKWLSALNPFSSKGGAKPKPALAARSAGPVQGELSLANVKVVRNDLSDADLVVVPLRSATGKASASMDAMIAAKGLADVDVLDRASASLRGAEQVPTT